MISDHMIVMIFVIDSCFVMDLNTHVKCVGLRNGKDLFERFIANELELSNN